MSETNTDEKKIILFPGDTFPFDQKLLQYKVFALKKEKQGEEQKQSLSSMKSVIFYPDRTKNTNKSKSKQNEKKDIKNNENIQESEENYIIPTMYYGNYYSAKKDDIIIGII